jgi:predicted Fe-Mo cluster-binding NifX family protein
VKTAFSIWEQRIAPVFDTARQILLIEAVDGRVTTESEHQIDADPARRLAWMNAQGVQTLVCGAVSRPLQERLLAAGIAVFPFVAGDRRQVVRAFLSGALRGAAFTMPGCCGRRRMRCGCGNVRGGRREPR